MYRTVQILFKEDIDTGEETVVRVFESTENAFSLLEINTVYSTEEGLLVTLRGENAGESYAYPFNRMIGYRVRLWDPIKNHHSTLALRQWQVH